MPLGLPSDVDCLLGESIHGLHVLLLDSPHPGFSEVEYGDLEVHLESIQTSLAEPLEPLQLVNAGKLKRIDEAGRLDEAELLGKSRQLHAVDTQIDAAANGIDFDSF